MNHSQPRRILVLDLEPLLDAVTSEVNTNGWLLNIQTALRSSSIPLRRNLIHEKKVAKVPLPAPFLSFHLNDLLLLSSPPTGPTKDSWSDESHQELLPQISSSSSSQLPGSRLAALFSSPPLFLSPLKKNEDVMRDV